MELLIAKAMRVYISGPLHAVADLQSARAFYECLGCVCRDARMAPYIPHLQTDPEKHQDLSPSVVFEKDFSAIRRTDILIAVIGTPSSGVGAELALAFDRGLPVIGLYHVSERPSRFVLGMLASMERATVIRYQDQNECMEQLGCALASLAEKLGTTLPH